MGVRLESKVTEAKQQQRSSWEEEAGIYSRGDTTPQAGSSSPCHLKTTETQRKQIKNPFPQFCSGENEGGLKSVFILEL